MKRRFPGAAVHIDIPFAEKFMQTSAVLPHRSTRHRLRRERRQHRQAAWIFLFASFAVFLGMLFFGLNAHSLPSARHRTLGAAYSVLVGVGIYFLSRSALWISNSNMPAWRKISLCLFLAALAVAAVFGAWEMGLSPIRKEEP